MRIGVDLGGSKIEAIALMPDGSIAARRRIETPKDDYAGIVAAIAGLVEAIEREIGEGGPVGVGIPGAVSRQTGLVKNANTTSLIGRPLDQDLARRIGRPVRLANDANCFALSEAADGAAAGARVVFGTILGTGVGGGIVVDGRVIDGVNAIAGEWGHNPLPWADDSERPGRPCFCGQSGCIETFVSGPALTHQHRAATGQDLDPAIIAERAEAGDSACRSSLQRYEHRLARAFAHLINILDPDVIVLGGGLSNIARLYRTVPALWSEWIFSHECETGLVKNRHGDSSGVRGAAWLWPEAGK